jgi:hypothetical protein
MAPLPEGQACYTPPASIATAKSAVAKRGGPLADRGIAEKRTFSYDEAAALLPEVRQITGKAYQQVEELRAAVGDGQKDAERFEAEATAIVNDWATRVRSFGIEVKGIWLVDFDNGSGYYCWRWPETALQFFHTHEEGFGGRMRIQ